MVSAKMGLKILYSASISKFASLVVSGFALAYILIIWLKSESIINSSWFNSPQFLLWIALILTVIFLIIPCLVFHFSIRNSSVVIQDEWNSFRTFLGDILGGWSVALGLILIPLMGIPSGASYLDIRSTIQREISTVLMKNTQRIEDGLKASGYPLEDEAFMNRVLTNGMPGESENYLTHKILVYPEAHKTGEEFLATGIIHEIFRMNRQEENVQVEFGKLSTLRERPSLVDETKRNTDKSSQGVYIKKTNLEIHNSINLSSQFKLPDVGCYEVDILFTARDGARKKHIFKEICNQPRFTDVAKGYPFYTDSIEYWISGHNFKKGESEISIREFDGDMNLRVCVDYRHKEWENIASRQVVYANHLTDDQGDSIGVNNYTRGKVEWGKNCDQKGWW